jgi:hypothetical protein
MNTEVPFVALWWVAALFPVVMLFPNSLCLLRRIDPAMNRHLQGNATAEAHSLSVGPVAKSDGGVISSIWKQIKTAPYTLRRVEGQGLTMSRLTAIFIAFLSVLGLMALDRGSGFLYGQF